ncbi:sensor domain-containing diguanylate cyclase [Novosphingobium nitrogenifigens]|nr:diguanylate cyclase [Novosphingobium nitrogenifigens]
MKFRKVSWYNLARMGALMGADALAGGLCYFLFATATIVLTSNGRNHAMVWPADAVILALLLSRPRRHWPVLLLAGWAGNLVANGVARGWVLGLVLYGAINMGQTLLAAHFVRRSRVGDDVMADSGSFGRFLFWAGLIAPALGAAAGALSSQMIYGQPLLPSFGRWIASNSLGFVIFTPFFKGIFDGSYARALGSLKKITLAENLAVFGLHVAVTLLVFAQNRLPLLYLPFSTLLLLTFRMGRLATHLGTLLVAVVAIIAALNHSGPMALIDQGPLIQTVFLQAYLAVLLCTSLPVAAVVSARADAQAELAAREETLRLVMARSPDAILAFDGNGICRWADGPLREYLGIEPDDIVGASITELSVKTGGALERMYHHLLASNGHHHTSDFNPARHPELTLEASLRLAPRQTSTIGSVIIMRDITVRKAREVAISKRAETDDLTGVLNRAGFHQRLNLAIETSEEPFSLALIDVDRFKSINDTYGHPVGDAALIEIVRRMKTGTRKGDVVGRLGGDEFAILFRCEMAKAETICKRITGLVSTDPIHANDNVLLLTSISCGVAQFAPGMSREQLVDAADLALYQAKDSGRNGVKTVA